MFLFPHVDPMISSIEERWRFLWAFLYVLQKQRNISFISHALSLVFFTRSDPFSSLVTPLCLYFWRPVIRNYLPLYIYGRIYYLSILLVGCHAKGSVTSIDNNFCGVSMILVLFLLARGCHDTGFDCPCGCQDVDIREQTLAYEH